MNKIIIESPIYSRYTGNIKQIKECLRYTGVFYKKGQHKKERVEYPAYLIKAKGVFYTGLSQRILKHCKTHDIPCEVELSQDMLELEGQVQPTADPVLPGFEAKSYQQRLIEKAISQRRGLLVSPTASGKTAIAMSIVKAFPDSKALFIVPRLSLVSQTIGEFEKAGFENITQVGDKQKDYSGNIVIATYQSFASLHLEKVGTLFDIVIVDEAHIATKVNSSYHKILRHVIAPIRIALTATKPTEKDKILILEGLIGPLIDQVSMEEGQKEGIVAEPYLKLIGVPKSNDLTNYSKYQDIYRVGIVNYRIRNKLITNEVKYLVEEGKTSLVFISQVDHGQILFNMLNDIGIKCEYVYGDVELSTRDIIKEKLENKELDCVIASPAWFEGVNIKSVDGVIIASGGKSETGLLQKLGRGLRRTDTKKEALIIDFLDEGKYLSEHSVARLKVYLDLGLL